jgi:hypothetical protein
MVFASGVSNASRLKPQKPINLCNNLPDKWILQMSLDPQLLCWRTRKAFLVPPTLAVGVQSRKVQGARCKVGVQSRKVQSEAITQGAVWDTARPYQTRLRCLQVRIFQACHCCWRRVRAAACAGHAGHTRTYEVLAVCVLFVCCVWITCGLFFCVCRVLCVKYLQYVLCFYVLNVKYLWYVFCLCVVCELPAAFFCVCCVLCVKFLWCTICFCVLYV